MRIVLINAQSNSSPYRRETWHGREYIVRPATLIVPGVLNGSEGKLYYPPDETGRNVDAWNGMPIVVRHPMEQVTNDKGEIEEKPVSARNPKILDKAGIGYVFSANHNDTLGAEMWFDINRTKEYDNANLRPEYRILPRLLNNEPIELSTGLFTDNEPVPEGTTHNGIEYKYIARNYKPDHVAILPDEKGACSVEDGCGVNVVNSDKEIDIEEIISNKELKSKVKRIISSLSGNRVPGQPSSKVTGRFKKVGQGTGKGEVHEHAQAGSLIVTDRHKELGEDAKRQAIDGLEVPTWATDSIWNKAKDAAVRTGYSDDYCRIVAIYQNMGGIVETTTRNSKGKKMNKSQLIKWLTANCSCWKGKDADKTLNGLTEEQLNGLKTNAENAGKFTIIVNRINNKKTNNEGEEEVAGVDIGGLADFLGVTVDPKTDPVGFVAELQAKLDEVQAKIGAAKPAPEVPVEEEMPVASAEAGTEEEKKEEEKMTGNKGKDKVLTMKEFEASMPPEAKAIWNSSKEILKEKKVALVKQLLVNVDAKDKNKIGQSLMKKTLEDLQERIALLPKPKKVVNHRTEEVEQEYDFSGNGGGPINNRETCDDVLDCPA